MTGFWNDRGGREKTLIGAALVLLALVVLWQFAYKPLTNYPAVQSRAYKQAELDLKIMQKGRGILRQHSTSQASRPVTILSTDQLQSTITKSAKTYGLNITRRQPKGEDEITLWLENTDSKAFYRWVDALTGGYNISLLRAQLNRNEDANIRAQVTFKLADKP